MGVRIRDAKLVFNVLLSEEHLEPDFHHFAFIVTCSITVKNETIALALAAVFFEEHMQIQKIFGLGVNIVYNHSTVDTDTSRKYFGH